MERILLMLHKKSKAQQGKESERGQSERKMHLYAFL